MKRILETFSIKPASNQIEAHAYFSNRSSVDFCMKNNISALLGSPVRGEDYKQAEKTENALEDPVVQKLSRKYGKSPAQILLRHLT